jgi:putative DNA primase/helicase
MCVAEGFATGATVHEATGLSVAVAFNAGNLESAAHALHENFPTLSSSFARMMTRVPGNPGLTTSEAADRRWQPAIPDFGSNRPEGATDFNDLRSSSVWTP